MFLKDMDVINQQIIDEIQNLLFDITVLGTVMGAVIGVQPLYAIMVAVLGISFCCHFYGYMSTIKLLKEAEGTTSAAVVANVSKTLQGMDVIQAYKAGDRCKTTSRRWMADSSTIDFNYTTPVS